jgi:hypothetical protein
MIFSMQYARGRIFCIIIITKIFIIKFDLNLLISIFCETNSTIFILEIKNTVQNSSINPTNHKLINLFASKPFTVFFSLCFWSFQTSLFLTNNSESSTCKDSYTQTWFFALIFGFLSGAPDFFLVGLFGYCCLGAMLGLWRFAKLEIFGLKIFIKFQCFQFWIAFLKND